jgi:poly-gamma-glutamate synthesis protein (capsule biosynthesis protein)
LRETLSALAGIGIRTAGAGADSAAARAPALIPLDGARRILVFSMGTGSSGIGRAWAAGLHKAGVWLLPDLSATVVEAVAQQIAAVKRPGDVVIASIHWGGNWGYAIPDAHRRFAHALIDRAGVDLVHGHSSHHPLAMELYRGKLVLYGCGDFLNDYEGIGGHPALRGDLSLLYLPVLNSRDGRLMEMTMRVMQIHRFRLRRASWQDRQWLAGVLDRESRCFGVCVEMSGDALRLRAA